MNNPQLEEILEKQNQLVLAWKRAEEQLDYALESNRSISKAIREARRARNEMVKLIIETNRKVINDTQAHKDEQ